MSDDKPATKEMLRAQFAEAAHAKRPGKVSVKEFEANPDKFPEIEEQAKKSASKLFYLARAVDWLSKTGEKGTNKITLSRAYHPDLFTDAIDLSAEIGDDLMGAEERALPELERLAKKYLSAPHDRAAHVGRLLGNLFCYKNPEGLFYRYVDGALEDEEGEVDNEYRDRLARMLFDAVGNLGALLADHIPDLDEDDPFASMGQIAEQDGMLWLDAVAIEWLETEGWSGWGTDPSGARELARGRWEKSRGGPELLRLWVDPDEAMPWRLIPVAWLCEHLWENRLRVERELQENAAGINKRLSIVTHRGAEYTKAPKSSGTISWALDGQGNVVEIENNEYTEAPGIVRYVPRSSPIMPKGSRPSQQTFPAALFDDEEIPLAVRTVNDTDAVLGPIEAKLALLMLVTAERGMVRDELGSVVAQLNHAKSRIRSRDYELTAKALRRVRRLGLVLPDGTDIQLFSVQAPATSIRKDMEVSWCYTQHFRKLTQDLRKKNSPLRTLNGQFLINLTATMAFNGNEGTQLRAYINSTAMWNDANDPATGKFSADQLPRFSRDDWAAKTNALSQGAVDYLAENRSGGNRHKASRDRKRVEQTLEALEKKGLLKVEGDTDDFQILPPNEYLEAYEKFRKGGGRPKGSHGK